MFLGLAPLLFGLLILIRGLERSWRRALRRWSWVGCRFGGLYLSKWPLPGQVLICNATFCHPGTFFIYFCLMDWVENKNLPGIKTLYLETPYYTTSRHPDYEQDIAIVQIRCIQSSTYQKIGHIAFLLLRFQAHGTILSQHASSCIFFAFFFSVYLWATAMIYRSSCFLMFATYSLYSIYHGFFCHQTVSFWVSMYTYSCLHFMEDF